jgi:hypothetical protein
MRSGKAPTFARLAATRVPDGVRVGSSCEAGDDRIFPDTDSFAKLNVDAFVRDEERSRVRGSRHDLGATGAQWDHPGARQQGDALSRMSAICMTSSSHRASGGRGHMSNSPDGVDLP